MAILDYIPGLEVTVEVDGRTATEYDNPNDDEEPSFKHADFHLADQDRPLPHVIKYIEAKPGAPFGFQIKGKEDLQFHDRVILFKDFVDGQQAEKRVSPDRNRRGEWSLLLNRLVKHTSTTHWTSSLFRFGNLDVGDAGDTCHTDLKKQIEEATHWGVLMLKCYHGAAEQPVSNPSRLDDLPPPKETSVSEKALKGRALDCITTFDNPTTEPWYQRMIIPYTDRKKRRPFAIFEFRYRTHEGLIKEGVIPRTATPTAADRVREMSDDEVRRLAQELLAERERAKTPAVKEEIKRGVKREIDLTDEGSTANFEERYKSRRRDDGHVEIDLTDD
ncbi:hypothetical protein V8F20_007837 [Naviculisporaceae sp. PSN 640]